MLGYYKANPFQYMGSFYPVTEYCVYNTRKEWDTTDNPMTKERSGLNLYTDYLTGCQYLKAGYFGGMTPRLDQNRQPICEIK